MDQTQFTLIRHVLWYWYSSLQKITCRDFLDIIQGTLIMVMLDRLSFVLVPRLEGVMGLILVYYGIFGPLITVVVTEQLLISLIPLAVLLMFLGVSSVGKRILPLSTGKTGHIPKGTRSDYPHLGFLLKEALVLAITLCLWTTLGAIFLYVVAVPSPT
jgi:hypothetical protein